MYLDVFVRSLLRLSARSFVFRLLVISFNPFFFHYGEDNEYVNRLKYHKKKMILVPASKVVHDGKQLLDKVDYNKKCEEISELIEAFKSHSLDDTQSDAPAPTR
jgi:GT2 family glycosyltransferase